MKASDIRAGFLDFFKAREHTIVKSAALVPKDDPTLLFTNAGMVQFKRVFTGEEKRDYHRAVTSQKCVRAGGKHNDLENVGYTARHHTFFEMLGNFSFGDYFKKGAIEFAWALLVDGFNLPADKLYATVYNDDDEAYELWQTVVGLPPQRIYRLGEKDNFWAMGDTGPCGPCSEILIDQGESLGCGRPDCEPGCDCDRYLELWNLVFMQFDRDASGNMTPLPKPSIDTGMGLERISAVVQGVLSNFETDLFMPLIEHVQEMSGVGYVSQAELLQSGREGPQTNVSLKAVADHARALTFLIGDGILPENIGRGYVLRRILRRAVRHGRLLGIEKPFLHKISGHVIDLMSDAYPELVDGRSFIQKIILNEEERFSETLDHGLKLLSDEIDLLKQNNGVVISGDVAFKLYDTFGFPLDLTADVARESGFGVDTVGFEAAMSEQKAQSRASWKGSGEAAVPPAVNELTARRFTVDFVGYVRTREEAELTLIMKGGQKVDTAGQGDDVELVFTATPFYGESGGQAGDTGRIRTNTALVTVTDTVRYPGNIVVHVGHVETGSIKTGDVMTLEVDEALRADTRRNHTATHLLHRILRQELGDHVKQAGSLVNPDRLRFDFTHFESIPQETLAKIERRVNDVIRENLPVVTQVMSMEEATATGAVALFEERYGDTVRVVSVGDFSMELCGGTHCRRSGDIGAFLIVAEGSVAAGVRRLEALTGRASIEAIQNRLGALRSISDRLKVSPDLVPERLDKIMARQKELEKQIEKGMHQTSKDHTAEALQQVKIVNGVNFLAAKVQVDNPKALRELGDKTKDKLKSGVIALAAESGGKALLLTIVTPDLQKRFHAGNIIKELAAVVGGGGGGRPDMAQAGGPKPEHIDAALKKAEKLVATA
jgi:alanyl-tRNA synthetase